MKIPNTLSAETMLAQVARMAVQHGGTVDGSKKHPPLEMHDSGLGTLYVQPEDNEPV